MPLLPVKKKKVEEKWVNTNYDKIALDFIPLEQLKSANHDPHLIDLMLADEERDASPEHTRQDIYTALITKDTLKILAASKNLTIQERRKIVEGFKYRVMNTSLADLKEQLAAINATRDPKSQLVQPFMDAETLREIVVLNNDEPLDLFDLCVRLENTKLKYI